MMTAWIASEAYPYDYFAGGLHGICRTYIYMRCLNKMQFSVPGTMQVRLACHATCVRILSTSFDFSVAYLT